MAGNNECVYEVLSPWAEADPVPYRGVSARVSDLAGKTIGLFCNTKRVAEPTLKVVEDRLKAQFPAANISWFYNTAPNETITEQPRKDEFEKWLESIDTIVAAYGD